MGNQQSCCSCSCCGATKSQATTPTPNQPSGDGGLCEIEPATPLKASCSSAPKGPFDASTYSPSAPPARPPAVSSSSACTDDVNDSKCPDPRPKIEPVACPSPPPSAVAESLIPTLDA
eukprot:GABV01014094.1.p2 GENE.GABV01014094.1~~GABV01014094.1.p2  ORF type:complete len:118 (-),score=12.71 GABV01014094.1:3-356(-)